MSAVTSKERPANASGNGGGGEKAKKSPLKMSMQFGIPVVIGIIIAFLPPPEMLSRSAMIYMGIFMCAILWLVFEVVAEAIVGILAMCLFVCFNLGEIGVVFAPFAGGTVWLVIGALGLAAAIAKSGLLKRIAFSVLKLFPENYRGQVLALFTTGLVISPLIPSTTAKSAILCPFASQVSSSLGYKKGSNGAKGLFNAAWLSSGILGMAFYSGSGSVFIVLGFLAAEEQAKFDWFSWLAMTFVWLIVLVILNFILTVMTCKPDGEGATIEKGFAVKQLKNLGPASKQEKLAGLFLALALIGWMTGQWTGLDAGIIALLVLSLMGITGLLTTSDFRTKIPWETVVFIGAVFSIAAQISALGIDKWLADIMGPTLEPLLGNGYILIPVVVIATYVIRLVVMSQTATTAIFFAILGGMAQAVGVNPVVILFTVYVSTLVWHFSFTNATYLSALASTGGEMVDHKDNIKTNVIFMVTNLIACTASVPLWQFLGYL